MGCRRVAWLRNGGRRHERGGGVRDVSKSPPAQYVMVAIIKTCMINYQAVHIMILEWNKGCMHNFYSQENMGENMGEEGGYRTIRILSDD